MMIPLATIRSRHSIAKFLHSPPQRTRRAIHASPPQRGGIFRNANGQWSVSIDRTGIFTVGEVFLILGGLFAIYMFYEAKDTEKKCKEFQARAHGFLAQGISERRKAVVLLIATREGLRRMEAKANEKGESFDKREALLKAETLKVLERQEKFLNDFDAGKPLEIASDYITRRRR